jgi:hypothetical protein
LAEVLFHAGEQTTAVTLATGVLDQDTVSMDREAVGGAPVRSAASTLRSVQGTLAVPVALAAVDRWSTPPRLESVRYMANMLRRRMHILQAAQVLIKADGPAAIERLTILARSHPKPPAQWFAGVMDLPKYPS